MENENVNIIACGASIVGFLAIAANGVLLCGAEPGVASEHGGEIWKTIYYGKLVSPWGSMSVRLCPGDSPRGLCLDLALFVSGGEDGRLDIRQREPTKGDINVRLHSGDGQVVSPKEGDGTVLGWVGEAGSYTGRIRFVFLWGENDLVEAWMEIRSPGAQYWLEIPYGFTRDPSAPLPRSTRVGGPRPAAAMKQLSADAKLVPWEYVEYDLGKIHEWQLTLQQSNPSGARCEVVLYRDGRWKLDDPRTSVAIRMSDGCTINGNCVSRRLHEDDMRRSDVFRFPRIPDDQRTFGTAIVTLGDISHRVTVPSSLFVYCHGVLDQQVLTTGKEKPDSPRNVEGK